MNEQAALFPSLRTRPPLVFKSSLGRCSRSVAKPGARDLSGGSRYVFRVGWGKSAVFPWLPRSNRGRLSDGGTAA